MISIISVLLLLTAGFFLYVSDYYKADPAAVSAMTSNSSTVKITKEKQLVIFHTKDDSGSALIFYPGGKVEAAAYYPLLSKLADNGITCVLVIMPFHLAVFDSSAADRVYEKLPDIKNWYIGGHSLGGAMASSYMANHQDKQDELTSQFTCPELKGLILLGAYIYGDISPEKALTIYGSNDKVLKRNKIDYDKNIVMIEGGNHAYYGNYGEQKGDGKATITREEQQDQTVAAITEFINQPESKFIPD